MNNQPIMIPANDDDLYLQGEIHAERRTKCYCHALLPEKAMLALLMCATARNRFPEEEARDEFRLPFERGLPIEPEDETLDLSAIGLSFLCFATFPWYDLFASQYFMEENVKLIFDFRTARIEYVSDQLTQNNQDFQKLVLDTIKKTHQGFIFYGNPIQVPYSLENGFEDFSLLNLISDWCSDSSLTAVLRRTQKIHTLYQLQNIIWMNKFQNWFHLIFEGRHLRILYVDQYASETYQDFETKFRGKTPLPFGEYLVDLVSISNLQKLQEPPKALKPGKLMHALEKFKRRRDEEQ